MDSAAMADMQDAFALARALDAALAAAAPARADAAVADYRDALYDYRADGDLDAFLAAGRALLDALPAAAGSRAGGGDGRCFRALDSVFSSG